MKPFAIKNTFIDFADTAPTDSVAQQRRSRSEGPASVAASSHALREGTRSPPVPMDLTLTVNAGAGQVLELQIGSNGASGTSMTARVRHFPEGIPPPPPTPPAYPANAALPEQYRVPHWRSHAPPYAPPAQTVVINCAPPMHSPDVYRAQQQQYAMMPTLYNAAGHTLPVGLPPPPIGLPMGLPPPTSPPGMHQASMILSTIPGDEPPTQEPAPEEEPTGVPLVLIDAPTEGALHEQMTTEWDWPDDIPEEWPSDIEILEDQPEEVEPAQDQEAFEAEAARRGRRRAKMPLEPVLEEQSPASSNRKKKKAAGGPRLTCELHLYMNHFEFELVPILIGKGGENTRKIAAATDTKVRVRGRGSGHKESNGKEAPTPLMLVVTGEANNEGRFQQAVLESIHLLDWVYSRYRLHCRWWRVRPRSDGYLLGATTEGHHDQLYRYLTDNLGYAPHLRE